MRAKRGKGIALVLVGLAALLTGLRITRGQPGGRLAPLERTPAEKPSAKDVSARGATTCGGPLNLGFHVQVFSTGLKAAVWYPATNAEAAFQYANGSVSAVALDAPMAACQKYPLVVFSHGYTGCGTQSVFFTEALARAGYIVTAPDHKDAACRVDQHFSLSNLQRAEMPFRKPEKWSPSTYAERRADIEVVLDEMARDTRFGPQIDGARIGGAGHSLGGYTIMGMAGGWSSWRDQRIKAALLFSPFADPFIKQGTVREIHIPIMYQGGTRDIGITPSLKRNGGGAYDLSNPPKFFMELPATGHFGWTNMTCMGYESAPKCEADSSTARLIDEYAIAFFDRYLKGMPAPLLDQPNNQLAEYRHDDR